MAGGWAETRCRTGKNLTPRKMPENTVHTHLHDPGVLCWGPLHVADPARRGCVGCFLPFAIYAQTDSPQECQSNEKYHETKLFSCQRDHPALNIRHEYPHPFSPPRLEPERKGRFQVFFGGKFCYQFYFVMKMENLITTPQVKWLLNGTSAPRCHPCPG